MDWFPNNKDELNALIKSFINKEDKKINGVIVPHAGYYFSGKTAGKAYSFVNNFSKAIIFGPSHYDYFKGIKSLKEIITPLGNVNIVKNNLDVVNYEHSVINQIPFLQFLGINDILPLVVGELSLTDAKKIANEFKDFDGLFVFSTDLSHFFNYDLAKSKDLTSIDFIKNLKFDKKIDACGINVLKVFFELAKIKNFKPKLVCYENSGDITKDKSSVVGYASFIF